MIRTMPLSPGRAALATLALVALATAVAVPSEPPWMVLGAAGLGSLCLFVVAADALLAGWLRNNVGRSVNLTVFVLERFSALLLTLAALIAATIGLAWAKLPESEVRHLVVTRGGLAVAVLILMAVTRSMAAADNEFLRLRRRLPVVPLWRMMVDALEFERTVAPRLIGSFLKTGLFAGVLLVVVATVAGLLIAIETGGGRTTDWTTWEEIPFLAKTGAVGGFSASFLILAVLGLTWMRLVAVARVRGRVPSRDVWNHMDRAFGTLGILPTLLTSIWLLLFVLMTGFSSYALADWLRTELEFGPAVAGVAGAAGGAGLLWLLVLFPTQWVLPLMTRHDCGWIRAIEASTRLIGIERTRAFIVGAGATGLALTVVGIPAACALLLGALDDLDPLIGILLREKTPREANAEAEEAEELSTMPQSIQRGYRYLHEGRYLDAVNTFQMYLRTHPEQLAATRGEAIAMLYLGNRMMARDRLERWLRLEPDDEEAQTLYREWQQGLWQEGGERFESARQKSVQHIGRGLSPRDLIREDDSP